MDILIVGDSFCWCRHTEIHWPVSLISSLPNGPHTLRGNGYSGASWWSARQNFLLEISKKVPDAVVFCHTDQNRIPSNNFLALNPTSVLRNKEKNSNDIVQAGQLYYQELFFQEFHDWCQLQWFKELDHILAQSNVPKVLHLHCFEYNVKYNFQIGSVFKRNLYNISNLESKNLDFGNDTRPNHFNEHNNKILGQQLAQIIENYPGNATQFDLDLTQWDLPLLSHQ